MSVKENVDCKAYREEYQIQCGTQMDKDTSSYQLSLIVEKIAA